MFDSQELSKGWQLTGFCPILSREATERFYHMDVLQLFTIPNLVAADKTQLTTAFLPVKTWNIERADRIYRPGIALYDNPDNVDVAGPDSVYDYYA